MEYLYIVVVVTLLYNLEAWLYFHYGTAQLDLTLLALSTAVTAVGKSHGCLVSGFDVQCSKQSKSNMNSEIEKCFNLKAEAFI